MTIPLHSTLATLTAALQRQGKFLYLFVVQVLLLALFPYLDRRGIPTIVFRALAVLAFVASVYAVSEKHPHRMAGVGLAILANRSVHHRHRPPQGLRELEPIERSKDV